MQLVQYFSEVLVELLMSFDLPLGSQFANSLSLIATSVTILICPLI